MSLASLSLKCLAGEFTDFPDLGALDLLVIALDAFKLFKLSDRGVPTDQSSAALKNKTLSGKRKR